MFDGSVYLTLFLYYLKSDKFLIAVKDGELQQMTFVDMYTGCKFLVCEMHKLHICLSSSASVAHYAAMGIFRTSVVDRVISTDSHAFFICFKRQRGEDRGDKKFFYEKNNLKCMLRSCIGFSKLLNCNIRFWSWNSLYRSF